MLQVSRDDDIKFGVKSEHRHQLMAYEGNHFLKESKIFRLQVNGSFVDENIEKN